MGLAELSRPDFRGHFPSGSTVDIVAVHGLYEGDLETWTDPQTNILWLRDLLSHEQLNARVLAYGYKAERLASPGEGTADRILPHATSLIAQLCGERELSNTSDRPIIFICHGFGGILVKRALVFSSTSRAKQVEHRRSIYVSTYGIIFMGTPHNGMSKDAILGPWKDKIAGPSQLMLSLLKESEKLREITDQFAPLMKNFFLYYFWEQIATKAGNVTAYIVDEDSAAPGRDNVEQCGVMATHSGMVKFTNSRDPGYRVVLATLRRSIKAAPEVIRSRWKNDEKLLGQERRAEAQALLHNQPQHFAYDNVSPSEFNEWYTVPRRSSNYFTGREKHAKQLKKIFSASPNPPRRHEQKIFVIHGLGGSGKTQFCLKYAEDNRLSYWGVFWIDASSEQNAESGFALLGQQAGKGATFGAGMHWLSTCPSPWLLVIDNADPDKDVSKYIPIGGKGHILITTTKSQIETPPTVGSFHFRGMDPEEAITLLLRSAHLPNTLEDPNGSSRKFAQGIASELGNLALALTHAGATIRKNIYTLDNYLNYYLGYRRDMISHPQITNADDANIITTWEIPFKKIAARVSLEHRDAVDIMHIFAFMHFESIPESIFQRFWNSINGAESELVDCPDILQNRSMLNEEAHARVIRGFNVLCDYSIIDYDPDHGLCSLHPVVHAWARSRLALSEYKRWLGCATTILAHCISSNLEASGRQFRRQLLPHIDSCARALELQFPSFPENPKQATEAHKFASVYAENGLWKKALQLQRKVIDVRAKMLGQSHKDTIQAKRSLGEMYWNLFDITHCIDVQTEIWNSQWWVRPSLSYWMTWPPWKPDHVPYCIALSDLTQTLWLGGKIDLSQQAGERAVAGLMKHLGPDDPITLSAMFNLARTYHHLRDYKKSHEFLVSVVRKRKLFFGADHPDTLMARSELGINYRALGQMELAERLVENVLKARKKTMGVEHAYTLWSVNELSKILCDRGRSGEAVSMLEEIVPIAVRTLGEDHVGMHMTESNLARAYALSKRWNDAEGLLQKLSGIIKSDRPDWIDVMSGYIHVRTKVGQLEETENDCNKVLDIIIKKKVISLDDPRTVGVAETLLRIYQTQGRANDILVLKKRVPRLNEYNDGQESILSVLYGAHDGDRKLLSRAAF